MEIDLEQYSIYFPVITKKSCTSITLYNFILIFFFTTDFQLPTNILPAF